MISPTKRQMDILRFVTGYQEAKGYAPTLKEIRDGVGLKATSGAHRMIDKLCERGLINRGKAYPSNSTPRTEVLHPPAIPRDPQGQPLYWVEVGK